MEGTFFFESSGDASHATFNFSSAKDYSSGNFEAAVEEIFIPNSIHLTTPEEPFSIAWVFKKNAAKLEQLRSWIKSKLDGRSFRYLLDNDEEIIVLEHLGTNDNKSKDPIYTPTTTLISLTDLIENVNKYMKNVAFKHRNDKPPSLHVKRGYVHTSPGYPGGYDRSAYCMIPIFGPKLTNVLGLLKADGSDTTEISNQVHAIWEKKQTAISSPSPANLFANMLYQEVQASFIESAVPGIEFEDLRILKHLPFERNKIGQLGHYKFNPTFYPMIKSSIKQLDVDVFDSNGIKAEFQSGKSVFKIIIRRKDG